MPLTTPTLDTAGLLALLEHEDAAGVLSIFVDAAADGTEIDLRNRLSTLERRVGDEIGPTLERLAPELDALCDPAGYGRGRALFAPLGGAEPTRFVTRLPLPNRVVLDERPFVHPLLECLERGRPAGVLLLTNDEAELLEWRLGELLVFARIEAEPDEPRTRPGPVVARYHQGATPSLEGRARDRRRRYLDRVAAEAVAAAAERGWERVVVSGDDRLTRPLAGALPPVLREHVIRDPRHLSGLDSNALARVVGELLERRQAEWSARLVESIRDAALAGRGGALGLSEVVAALNEARVAHLVYDPDVRHAGALAAHGRLAVPPERDPLAEPLTAEPRLTERLVERCLTTGARVTPVAGSALLTELGGVAARLRW